MSTINAINSNNQQFVGEKIPEILPQIKENVTKASASDDNKRKIKARKRTLENIAEMRVLTQEENTVPKGIPPPEKCKSEKRPNPSIRFNYSLGHFPHIDKSRTVRCKNNECDKKTYVFCSICNVHLCFCLNENRNCFKDFHTIKK